MGEKQSRKLTPAAAEFVGKFGGGLWEDFKETDSDEIEPGLLEAALAEEERLFADGYTWSHNNFHGRTKVSAIEDEQVEEIEGAARLLIDPDGPLNGPRALVLDEEATAVYKIQ